MTGGDGYDDQPNCSILARLVAPGWAEATYTRTVKKETSFSEVLTDTTLLAQHKDGVYTAS